MRAFFYTPEDIAEARRVLLEEQEGRCAICERLMIRAVPDHCHRQGLIRGLLCPQCNTGLGMFGDSISTLLAAVTYLASAEERILNLTDEERSLMRKWSVRAQLKEQRARADAYREASLRADRGEI